MTSGSASGSARRRIVVASVALAVGAGAAVGVWVVRDGGGDRAKLRPLSVVVDPSIVPSSATIDGHAEGDPPRTVGRVVGESGVASDVVLGELIVSALDRARFDAFLRRVGGRVVDTFEPEEPGDPADYLVRVDASQASVDRVAADLGKVDPELGGRLRVGNDDTLRLLALAASESARFGVEISPNLVAESDGFGDGTSIEVPTGELDPNAFTWPFLNSGSAQDTGVAAALSLLDQRGKLKDRVKIMVVDGGFIPNKDFPLHYRVHETGWGSDNRLKCAGNPCPYHGTSVVLAAMGQIDNRYGTAGPAGPVAELIAVGAYSDKWKTYRRTLKLVKEFRPSVVNFSLGYGTTTFKAATQAQVDRRFKSMAKAGALVVASAGNDGDDVDQGTSLGESIFWSPCESKYVLCVGGLAHDSVFKDKGSNFGSDGDSRSVEIYAPFKTVTVADEAKASAKPYKTRYVTGTSFSAPFVAGVAALVKAADPTLGPDEIRKILLDTAHVGGVHFEHVIPKSKQRRINALAAVATVLGVTVKSPTVTITAPKTGEKLMVGEDVEFEGTAADFSGRRLPLSWSSSLEGEWNAKPTKSAVFRDQLRSGSHVITATARDIRGVEGTAQITVTVLNTPPQVAIIAPAAGFKVYVGIGVDLIGWTKDPDTNTALLERQVTWTVRKAGTPTTVFSETGHSVSIAGSELPVGSYIARFTANDASAVATAERTFTVQPVEPGKTPPVPQITSPKDGATYYQNGNTQPTISLTGKGTDSEDGSISGTRMRWTAISEQGTKKTLCVGSNFPGTGGGGFVTPKDCKQAEVKLGIDPGTVGSTTWVITLEVADSTGQISADSVGITIIHTTG